MRFCFPILLCSFFATVAFGQKAELDSLVDKKLYLKNIKIYRTILKDGPNKDVSLKLAEALRAVENNQEAVMEYASVIDRPDINPIYYKHYSDVLCKTGDLEECKRWELRYKESAKRADKTSDAVIDIDTSKHFLSRVPFNSPETDFGPAFYKGGILYVSAYSLNSKNTVHQGTGESFYHFYYAEKKKEDGFQPPMEVFKSINSATYEGPMSLSADNSTIFFNKNNFSDLKAKSKDKKLILQIVQGVIENDEITNISDFPYNNEYHTCTHPTISADGKELYFASTMDSTQGGSDIFVSKLINGKWAAPENLGVNVNSAEDEVYPFISSDGKLYFSSAGNGSMGGYDVFVTEKKNGVWQKALNLGLPFNTIFDDFSLIKNESQGVGYLSSNRASSIGSDDIFTFSNAYTTSDDEKKYHPLLISLINKDNFSKQKGNKIRGVLKPNNSSVSFERIIINLLDKNKTVVKRSFVTKDGHFSFSNVNPDNYLVNYQSVKLNAAAELSMINKVEGFVDAEELVDFRIGEIKKDSLLIVKNNFVVGKLNILNKSQETGEQVSLILADSVGKIIKRVEVGRNGYFVFRNLPIGNYFILTEDFDPNYICEMYYHNPEKTKSINRADMLTFHYRHLHPDSLRDKNIILHGRVKQAEPEGEIVLLLDGSDNVIDRTITNKDGYFVFRELDGENMHVLVMNDHPLLDFIHNTIYQLEDSVYHVTEKMIYKRLPYDTSVIAQKVVINGRLTSGNKPLENKLVLLVDKYEMVVSGVITNADGFFAFHHLNPDDYYIVVDSKEPDYLLERNINREDSEMMVSEGDFSKFNYKKLTNDQVVSLQGEAFSKSTQKPIADQLLLLLDENGKIIRHTVLGKNGKFTFVNLKPDNYLMLFQNYDHDQKIKFRLVKDEKMKDMEVDEKKERVSVPIVQTESKLIVFFDYNSDKLKAKDAQKVLNFYKSVHGKEIELHGFTDMSGSDSFNLALAKKRILACEQILKTANLDLKTNEVPEGRTNKFGERAPALNRRVELKLKEN